MPVFEFVDADDPTSRTRAKSHVARKAHRERRLREIEQFRSRAPPTPRLRQYTSRASCASTPPDAPQVVQPIKKEVVLELLQPPQTQPLVVLTPPDTESGSIDDDDEVQKVEDSGGQTALDTYASRVSARPQDAFWTVYAQLDAGDRNLLQWYLVTVPELSFGITHTGPLNPMRDWVFPLVASSSAVLNSSLLIGAVNNPSYFQGEGGASRVLVQKGKTISLINQALRNGQTAIKDDILYAVAATAISEDRLGNPASCRTHLDGLQHMIRLRGGIRSLRKNPALCAALAWAEISVANYAAQPACSPDSNDWSKVSMMARIEARYEEKLFCDFMTTLQRVQLSRRRSHDPLDNLSCDQTESLFQRGSPLLAMLGDWVLDSGVITPISKMNANNCQLACLFYINFMICECFGSAQLMQSFLARLSTLVRTHSRGKVPRASLFIWVFFREIELEEVGLNEMDRLEWLIRMIRVARKLSAESSHMLQGALIESLKSHESLAEGMRVSNDLGILASRVEIGLF